MFSVSTTTTFLLSVLLLCYTAALDNGLGRVPPMGWNSWNGLGCQGLNQGVVTQTAELIVSLGLKDAGYKYINLDDCWMAPNRTINGACQADSRRFPSGMKKLGDYIHSKGLLFGIYSSAGTNTCQGLPGSLNYEEMDARTFAKWGVDLLKYDNCYNQNKSGIDRYPKMRDALNKTGRPIFYSLCQWGEEESWRWARDVGNSYRSTPDIAPTWDSIRWNFLKSQEQISHSVPGSWADPDMMEIGNGNLTLDEEKSHFALWCMTKAPLILGMDLRTISNETLSIISNQQLISVHQNMHAKPATCFIGCSSTNSDFSVYATTVSNGDTVMMLINWNDAILSSDDIHVMGQDVGVVPTPSQSVVVTDLWSNETFGTFDFDTLKSIPIPTLAPHASVVYRLSIVDSFTAKSLAGLQIHNSLAQAPPMGWNSWNKFGCNITERDVRNVVNVLSYSGLSELGYNYVNIDDCWMAPNRTRDGIYQADPDKFPSGMKDLGDYVHSKGLKFGIYTSAGTKTCQGLPGSLGMEFTDASTFADWGVDFLKYDNCYNEKIPGIDRYTKMRDALNATGRPIFYSLCQWGDEDSWRWAPSVGNAWRSTRDISPHWGTIKNNFLQNQQQVHRSQPGAWSDPDMMEVGNGNLTLDESKSHFALWCLAKAPLWLGMDLTTMTADIRNIVFNKNLIRVNQDAESLPAVCFKGCNEEAAWSVYATRVTGGDTVAIIVNWNETLQRGISLAAYEIGIVPTLNELVKVKDLWTNNVVGMFDFDELKKLPIPAIPPHASLVYRFSTLKLKRGDTIEIGVNREYSVA